MLYTCNNMNMHIHMHTHMVVTDACAQTIRRHVSCALLLAEQAPQPPIAPPTTDHSCIPKRTLYPLLEAPDRLAADAGDSVPTSRR